MSPPPQDDEPGFGTRAPRAGPDVPDEPVLGVHTVRELAADAAEKGWISALEAAELLAAGPVSLSPSDSARDLAEAELVGPRPLATLGRGGQGEVLVALDDGLGRPVAVKRLLAEKLDEPGPARAFLAEARITAQLDHPGVVPVYSLETDAEGRPTYSMKLVRGRTLGELIEDAAGRLARGEPLPSHLGLQDRLDLFLRICETVAYAHDRGVVHRDLKPDNVMVGAFGELLVLDWGIARVIGSDGAIVRGPTGPLGDIVGTPAFMAPEQAMGDIGGTDARSDQFALGLILHELVGLRPPREGADALDRVMQAMKGRVDPLRPPPGLRRLPPELPAIVARATAKDREDRYPDVLALAEDVRRFLHDEPVLALPDTASRRMQRWVSRHRSLALNIGLGLVLLALLIGLAGLLAVQNEQRRAREREQRLSVLQAATAGQAHRIDDALRGYESLLAGLAGAAEEALTRPGAEPEELLNLRPPGPDVELVDSPLYRATASSRWPDYYLAEGLTPAEAAPRLEQLSTLRWALRRTTLRSWRNEALTEEQIRRGVLFDGVPLVWSYLATEEGIAVGYPGTMQGYPDKYDPRERSWYQSAARARTRVWSAVDEDESGMGLLLTCSVALRDEDDRLLGVAAVDLTFGRVIDTLLDPARDLGQREAFLVDAAGYTVVRSSQKSIARGVETYRQAAFPWPELLERTRGGGEAGHALLSTPDGDRLVLWSRMQAVDWTYVLEGEPEAMLHP